MVTCVFSEWSHLFDVSTEPVTSPVHQGDYGIPYEWMNELMGWMDRLMDG